MPKLTEVFIAGGLPTITYVPRTEHRLEGAIRDYLDTRYTILSISGATKSGKTVLVRRILPKDQAFWIPGGQIRDPDHFWELILDYLGGHTTTGVSFTTNSTKESNEQYVASVKPAGIGVEGTASEKDIKSTAVVRDRSRTVSPAVAAIRALTEGKVPVIIDDFHYVDREVQAEIIRSLKEPVFEGLPVVLISVPHRAFDAVRVEREMTGRVTQLSIPAWVNSELSQIPQAGFKALNASCDPQIVSQLVKESFLSPHLMQDFCLALGKENGVDDGVKPTRITQPPHGWEGFFRNRAANASKSAFDRLAQGPRQRKDRMVRTLVDGSKCDIYVAVLMAIASTGPKISLTYEDIRSGLREVMKDEIPQANEVTRILEKMGEIAQTEIVGEPVVDWDREYSTLHISDPFFAYYLRWGVKPPLRASLSR